MKTTRAKIIQSGGNPARLRGDVECLGRGLEQSARVNKLRMTKSNAVDHPAMQKPPTEDSRDWRGFSQQVAREVNDLLGGKVFLHPGDTHLKFSASKAGNKVKQEVCVANRACSERF